MLNKAFLKIKAFENKIKYFILDFPELCEFYLLLKNIIDWDLFKSLLINLYLFHKNLLSNAIALLFIKNDNVDVFLDIHSGAGGNDAQAWVSMLLKMYTNWFIKKSFKYKILSMIYGEYSGLKSVSIKITGNYALGWLKHETGIHRLVRCSPFDSNKKRHTSFAYVCVYPDKLSDKKISIQASDLRIDTFKSSGAGGQHVNTTESGVRVLHKPSGIVVQSQSERSQHKNKNNALKQLTAKINLFYINEKKIKHNAVKNINLSISWSNQIRSYFFDTSIVKDLRSNFKLHDIHFVLKGNIDLFVLSVFKYINKI